MRVLSGNPESVGLTPQTLDSCRGCRRVRRIFRKLPGWLLCSFHEGYSTGYVVGYEDALVKEAE